MVGTFEEMIEDFNNGTYDFTDNGRIDNLLGLEVNGIKVVSYAGINKNHRSVWNCICHCGNEFTAVGCEIKRGKTKSCGCLAKRIHGLYKSRLYRIHHCMMNRCYLENSSGYMYYGAKGVKVCDEWHNFLNFYNWAVNNGYNDDLTLDRIDGNGNYEPSNCRWVTRKEQSNNLSSNRIITFNGTSMTLTRWSEKINIDRRTLNKRLSLGWSVEKTLTTPVNKNLSRSKQK